MNYTYCRVSTDKQDTENKKLAPWSMQQIVILKLLSLLKMQYLKQRTGKSEEQVKSSNRSITEIHEPPDKKIIEQMNRTNNF